MKESYDSKATEGHKAKEKKSWEEVFAKPLRQQGVKSLVDTIYKAFEGKDYTKPTQIRNLALKTFSEFSTLALSVAMSEQAPDKNAKKQRKDFMKFFWISAFASYQYISEIKQTNPENPLLSDPRTYAAIVLIGMISASSGIYVKNNTQHPFVGKSIATFVATFSQNLLVSSVFDKPLNNLDNLSQTIIDSTQESFKATLKTMLQDGPKNQLQEDNYLSYPPDFVIAKTMEKEILSRTSTAIEKFNKTPEIITNTSYKNSTIPTKNIFTLPPNFYTPDANTTGICRFDDPSQFIMNGTSPKQLPGQTIPSLQITFQ